MHPGPFSNPHDVCVLCLSQEARSLAIEYSMKACGYLSTKLADVTDPLQMAFMAYALDRCGHVSRSDAYSRLKLMNRTSELSQCL